MRGTWYQVTTDRGRSYTPTRVYRFQRDDPQETQDEADRLLDWVEDWFDGVIDGKDRLQAKAKNRYLVIGFDKRLGKLVEGMI